MNDLLLKQINSENYSTSSKGLKSLLSKGELTEEQIFCMLNIENKLIISDFLLQYKHFTYNILEKIEKYIVQHLDDPDRLFVSDLIEFASDRGLSLPYQKCIDFLSIFGNDDDYVILASIDYITENIKVIYIKEIVEGLQNVLNNPSQNQSTQIKAAFALFRITMKRQYLKDLMDLVVNGDNNKELLQNILRLKWNTKKYFDYADMLSILTG